VPSITLRHLDFNYDSPYAEVFKDLSLLIDSGWRTGLVGRNGQGKSTLLRLIAGQLSPLAGELDVPVRTRYFPLEVNARLATRDAVKDAIAPFRAWEAEMSALLAAGDAESVTRYGELHEQFTARGGYAVEAAIEAEFSEMRLPQEFLDRPLETLSGGEQTRALIVSLFVDGGAFPLIDEPTNHLDIEGRQLLLEYLARKPGFLLVSHDRHFLDGAVDHIVSINKSDVRVNRGNFSQWRRHMDEELLHEQRTRENIEREVKQLARAARERRRGADAREKEKRSNNPARGGAAMKDTGFIGHRAAKQMKKAITIERRIDDQLKEKRGLLKNKEKERTLKIETRSGQGARLLTVQNVSIGYGGTRLLQNVSFPVSPGDRIALLGPNGCGKTTLLNAICGEVDCLEGFIHKPGHVRISRAYQQPRWGEGSLRERIESAGIEETRFRQLMGVFGIPGDVFERDLATFSQGQLKKVDLCRSMMHEADLLLWDEPLNYVDLYSRTQIEAASLDYHPTLVFIEHDRAFVDNVATEIVSLRPNPPASA
jgi:lincosamide and streptogramin A transport system ATP-binding/permease protein